MKQRFSSLDVRAISHELHATLAGTRLTNVYDLVPPGSTAAASSSSSSTPRTLLLRFSRGQDKHQLVVDSGFRCHLTAYDARASAMGGAVGGGSGASNAPSAFVARLRTFLNGRHVTAVAQVGTDRIVELRFTDGQLRLYLEFFAAGNVVLTNAEAKVLALQRTVAAFRSASLEVTLSVGSTYGLASKQNVDGTAPLTVEAVRAALQTAAAADAADSAPGAQTGAKKKKNKNKSLSRTLAMAFTDLPQVLIDHVLLTNNIETTTAAGAVKAADVLADETRVEALFHALEEARALALGLTTAGPTCQGYIIAAKKAKQDEAEEPVDGDVKSSTPASKDLDYVDFHPFSPRQFEKDSTYVVLPFDSFNKAADEFYSHLQGLKANRQLHQQESAASRKLEATKRDQATRIESLQETQKLNVRKAAAIEANQDWVQAAIDAVNEQLRLGTDWEDLGHLIENSAESNPVAALIKLPMRLGEGIITVQISEESLAEYEEEDEGYGEYEEEEEEEGTDEEEDLLDVDVKLSLSAWSNAREYYDQKRVAAEKEQKTKEVAALALRNAEKKVAEELKRVQKGGKPAPQLIRRQLWFEKFFWFISSDGYLVLAGRESQQCELLYRRYLRRGDVCVLADIRNAPGIVVVKNRPDTTADAPIPPATLAQAGTLAVCASEAWDNKANLGAYWVHTNQVFKTTTSGDVLPLGSFDIRGEKNHLAPPQKILGFGLFFKISNARTREVEVERAEEEGSVHEEQEMTHDQVSPGEEKEEEEKEGEEKEGEKKEEEEKKKEEEEEEEEEEKENEEKEKEEKEIEEIEEIEDKEEEEEDSKDTGGDQKPSLWKGKQKEHLRSASPTPSHTSTAATGAATTKRGKKAKAKKLAKYKDQDEEDRARAEQLIGIAAGREKAEAKARAKAQREAELAAYEERRRAQRERQIQATRAFEAARQAKLQALGDDHMADEDEDETVDGDGDGSLGLIDMLVGRAAVGDEILEAVPVCAPWMALARLKYKVKIQPGQTKKGRAMRDVLERWRHAGEAGRNGNKAVLDEQSQDPERMWPREVELIRAVKMEEAANCVPVSKMTLMMTGGLGGGGGSGGGKGGKGGKQTGQGQGKRGGKGGKGKK